MDHDRVCTVILKIDSWYYARYFTTNRTCNNVYTKIIGINYPWEGPTYIRHAVKYLMTHYLYLETEYNRVWCPLGLKCPLCCDWHINNLRIFSPEKFWWISGQIFWWMSYQNKNPFCVCILACLILTNWPLSMFPAVNHFYSIVVRSAFGNYFTNTTLDHVDEFDRITYT